MAPYSYGLGIRQLMGFRFDEGKWRGGKLVEQLSTAQSQQLQVEVPRIRGVRGWLRASRGLAGG